MSKITLSGVIHDDLSSMAWYNERASGSYSMLEVKPDGIESAFEALVSVFGLTAWRRLKGATAYSDVMYVDASFMHGTLTIKVHDSILAQLKEWAAGVPQLKRYITWYYQDDDGIDKTQFPLRGPFPTDQFYPWMDRPLKQMSADFLKSSANVLLLVGPPGTGKTSFIKSLVYEMAADAWLTYDEGLHTSDKLHKDFMSPTEEPRVLILEDADVILSARQDGNKAMGRLLNLADGMVSTGQRKIIFSTNLPNIGSVDPALLRPGRCFGVLKFRELDRHEAEAACISVGRPFKLTMRDNERVPLAVAINGRAHDSIVLRMGFTE